MTDLGYEEFIPLRVVAAIKLKCCNRTAAKRLAKAGFEPLEFNSRCSGITGSDLASLDAQAEVLGTTVDRMLRKLTQNPYSGVNARWGINSQEFK